MSRCQEVEQESLVGYLYDELSAGERARLDGHLAICGSCREELDEMRSARRELATWAVPEVEPGFAALPPRPAATHRWVLRAGLAAAAVLLLSVAAGIANLDIRYGEQGLSIRTGWSRPADTQSVRAVPETAAAAAVTAPRAEAGADAAPWRGDLSDLERRLRTELAPAEANARAAAARPAPAHASSDAELLARVRALIEQSETRQRRELALRVAQLAREFDSQRQTDLVRIQQGLGQLEGSTAVDRELLNYLVRVSQRR